MHCKTSGAKIMSREASLVGGRAACLFAMAVVIAGCGRDALSSKDSQVVATVNDRELTISQLKQMLYSSGSGAVSPDATKQAIDSLVNQELLVQQAVESKLDRDPAVVRALESGRRQVLARAYAERNLYPKEEITEVAKQQYYRSNPALFEHRKIYHVYAYSMRMQDLSQSLRDALEQTHSSDQVRDLLKRREVAFEVHQATIAAEELPLDMLPQFTKASVGDALIMPRSDGKALLLSLVGVADSPLDFDQASGRISQYLVAARNQQAIEDFLKKAKAVAKITINEDAAGVSLKTASAPGDHLTNGVKGL
jgi:EpsD family peptidyl-prolyl cis-trans isomerase